MDRAGTILFATDVGDNTLLKFTLLPNNGWAIHRGDVLLDSGSGVRADVERGTDHYMTLLHKAHPRAARDASMPSARPVAPR